MKKLIALALCAMMILTAACAMADTLLVGTYTSVDSTAATADAAGKVAVDTTICSVVLDDNGTIVAIKFDAIQPKAAFKADGTLDCAESQTVITKREKGLDYNMKGVSPIGLEWYEQMDGFETWCIGKNIGEVLGMQLDDQNKATDADVLSTCTIHINAQLAALKAAVAMMGK